MPAARVTPVLRRSWSMLTALEGANDGMVSMASARWGEYLGTIYADHFAQTPHGRPPTLTLMSGGDRASLLELPTAEA